MATILIVDDDALSRQFLLTLLGYGKHTLFEAADGVEGLKQALKHAPGLIISDILMPNMDGLEFIKRIRADEKISATPVIFYTATYREREASMIALACDVKWVLPKPSEPDVILNRVAEALGLPPGKTETPQIFPILAESGPLGSIDHQVSEYLVELEEKTRQISQFAQGNDENLLSMSQSINKSLDSLQAVSLRLTALIDLGLRLATEREEEPLLESSCRVAQNICVAKYAAIGILDHSGTKLKHFITRGFDESTRRRLGKLEARQGVLGNLLQQGGSLRLSAADGLPNKLGLPAAHPPVRSFLGVPIVSRENAYGWLYLVDKLGAQEFSEVDERVATTIAAQLAVTYENLVLLEQLKRSHVDLQEEMAARMRVDEQLQRFRTAMDASADAIFLVDQHTNSLIDVNDTACRMLSYRREQLLSIRPDAGLPEASESFAILFREIIAYSGPQGRAETELPCGNGALLPVEITRRFVSSSGHAIMVAVARDVTERRQTEQRLVQLAHYDPLTGLPNRMLFYHTLTQALKQAGEHGLQVAVLFIDLDRFKNVNDTLGHPIGDELLRQFSLRVLSCVRVRDTIGRIGGDEFALILTIPEGQQTAGLVAMKIQEALHRPFLLGGHELTVAVSIGITVFPNDAQDAETLIKFADTAMYQAKESGRNTYRFFTQEMNLQAQRRLDLENALRRALENREFTLHYQPQISLATGKIVGAEALIRWQRPEHGLVSPAEFIPILEDTGLIVRAGIWVIQEACRQIRRWRDTLAQPIQIAVNVSGKQFYDQHLEADIMAALTEHGVAPELLEIELTESALMVNPAQTTVLLGRLNDLGIKISIDDFGTGYSSLAYLKRFPIDKLKVDIAFVREVTSNPDDAAITKAIIQMAHSLKLSVIAEGVETAEQLAFLHAHQCDEIQGYYFSRPVTASAFEEMVRQEKHLSLPAPSSLSE